MLQIINPATEEVLREIVADNAEAVLRKFERLSAAQPAWASTTLEERMGMMVKLRDALVEQKHDIAATLTAETGKPLRHSVNEITAAAEHIDFFVHQVEGVLEPATLLRYPAALEEPPLLQERVTYEPLGVVAYIGSCNCPVLLGINTLVPALLLGSSVLYKPSRLAALSGQLLVDMLHKVGIPKEVLLAVIGTREVGAEVVRLPLAALFVTGSEATGAQIGAAAAPHITRLKLDLSGKDALYVCDDVDVRLAAHAAADGAFYSAGLSQFGVERIYVHQRIADAFVQAFVERVQQFVVGAPSDEKTFVGPLPSRAHVAVLQSHVADALERGARLLCGGAPLQGKGFFFAPTVLAQVQQPMAVMREESFGPIVGVAAVDSDAAALAMMNDTPFGRTASVFSSDEARAEAILRRVQAGTVFWNCCDRVSPRLPWAPGRKHSGGSGTGLAWGGMRAFVQPKAWHLQRVGGAVASS